MFHVKQCAFFSSNTPLPLLLAEGQQGEQLKLTPPDALQASGCFESESFTGFWFQIKVYFLLFLGVIPLCCSSPQTLPQEFWARRPLRFTWEDLLLGQEVTATDTTSPVLSVF